MFASSYGELRALQGFSNYDESSDLSITYMVNELKNRRLYYRTPEVNSNLFLHSRGLCTISDGLIGFENLKLLHLEYNAIEDIKKLSTLTLLRCLHINNNCIPRSIDIGNLLNLRVLDLSNNFLTSLEGFKTLLLLETLHVSNNRLGAGTSYENLLIDPESYLFWLLNKPEGQITVLEDWLKNISQEHLVCLNKKHTLLENDSNSFNNNIEQYVDSRNLSDILNIDYNFKNKNIKSGTKKRCVQEHEINELIKIQNEQQQKDSILNTTNTSLEVIDFELNNTNLNQQQDSILNTTNTSLEVIDFELNNTNLNQQQDSILNTTNTSLEVIDFELNNTNLNQQQDSILNTTNTSLEVIDFEYNDFILYENNTNLNPDLINIKEDKVEQINSVESQYTDDKFSLDQILTNNNISNISLSIGNITDTVFTDDKIKNYFKVIFNDEYNSISSKLDLSNILTQNLLGCFQLLRSCSLKKLQPISFLTIVKSDFLEFINMIKDFNFTSSYKNNKISENSNTSKIHPSVKMTDQINVINLEQNSIGFDSQLLLDNKTNKEKIVLLSQLTNFLVMNFSVTTQISRCSFFSDLYHQHKKIMEISLEVNELLNIITVSKLITASILLKVVGIEISNFTFQLVMEKLNLIPENAWKLIYCTISDKLEKLPYFEGTYEYGPKGTLPHIANIILNLQRRICKDKFETFELADLAGLTSITTLNLKKNSISNFDCLLQIMDTMALRAVYLTENPFTKENRRYRKILINRYPSLQYIDDAPVLELERLAVKAYMENGLQGERECRIQYKENIRLKEKQQMDWFLAQTQIWKNEGIAKRQVNEQ